MRRKCIPLIYSLLVLMLFSGCQRRFMPNRPSPNRTNRNFRISAARDRADFYYGTVTNNTRAQVGMDGASPISYTVPSGNQVRIIGKYDGYYVAVLPNNRIGLMPLNSTTPYAPQGTTIGQPGTTGGTTGTTPGTPGSTSGGLPGNPGTPQGTSNQPGTGINGGTTGGTTGGQTGTTAPGGAPAGSTAGGGLTPDASTMISLVNQARAQAGLKALNTYNSLVSVANMKAQDIAKNNYFSHTSPTYGSPFDMMKSNGISYLYAGENLALNQNVQAAEQALMNSPEHKANILNPNFTDIGIGIAQKSDGSYIYVQQFIGR